MRERLIDRKAGVIRMLDAVVDLCFYPTGEAEDSKLATAVWTGHDGLPRRAEVVTQGPRTRYDLLE